jgi:hypothetical protein
MAINGSPQRRRGGSGGRERFGVVHLVHSSDESVQVAIGCGGVAGIGQVVAHQQHQVASGGLRISPPRAVCHQSRDCVEERQLQRVSLGAREVGRVERSIHRPGGGVVEGQHRSGQGRGIGPPLESCHQFKSPTRSLWTIGEGVRAVLAEGGFGPVRHSIQHLRRVGQTRHHTGVACGVAEGINVPIDRWEVSEEGEGREGKRRAGQGRGWWVMIADEREAN